MINYSYKWIIQRITAIILIPLTFWFIYHCLLFASMSYNELIIFFKSITNSLLFLLMMIAMLFHAKLGCESINEDYFKNKSFKKINNLLINIIIYFSIFIVTVAIFRIILI